MKKLETTSIGMLTAGLFAASSLAAPPQESANLNSDTFDAIHRQIRPQPGESRWMEVPWLTDLHDARVKAAAEGKPLFLSASGKGLSIGMC